MIIAPSILAVDFTKFESQIKLLNNTSAKWIHFDVMDGHFVPMISYGPKIFEDVKKMSTLFMDVHLMVSKPLQVASWFKEADLITFHIEAVNREECKKMIQYLKDKKIKVGIAIKPQTEISSILEYLADIDLVLVMSVEPGFGGQKFLVNSLPKIKELKSLRQRNNYKYLIEVDGGINETTIKEVADAGVDVAVAGSYVFQDDIASRIQSLLK